MFFFASRSQRSRDGRGFTENKHNNGSQASNFIKDIRQNRLHDVIHVSLSTLMHVNTGIRIFINLNTFDTNTHVPCIIADTI